MKWEFSRELLKEDFSKRENITLNYLLFLEEIINKQEINFETIREVNFKKCKFSGSSESLSTEEKK